MSEIDPLHRVHGHACAHLVMANMFSRDTLDTTSYIVYGDASPVHHLPSQTAKVVIEAVGAALVEVCGGINGAPGEILERYNYIVSLID